MDTTTNFLSKDGEISCGLEVDLQVSGNFRTELTESFTIVKGEKRATAKFCDPVVSKRLFGFSRSFSDITRRVVLTARMGVSLKQTRTERYTAMTGDPRTREPER